MEFELEKAILILERTPKLLQDLLERLSSEWIYSNEGEDTWSPYDVIGHLIHGEKTDWMIRTEIILSNATKKYLSLLIGLLNSKIAKEKIFRYHFQNSKPLEKIILQY